MNIRSMSVYTPACPRRAQFGAPGSWSEFQGAAQAAFHQSHLGDFRISSGKGEQLHMMFHSARIAAPRARFLPRSSFICAAGPCMICRCTSKPVSSNPADSRYKYMCERLMQATFQEAAQGRRCCKSVRVVTHAPIFDTSLPAHTCNATAAADARSSSACSYQPGNFHCICPARMPSVPELTSCTWLESSEEMLDQCAESRCASRPFHRWWTQVTNISQTAHVRLLPQILRCLRRHACRQSPDFKNVTASRIRPGALNQ